MTGARDLLVRSLRVILNQGSDNLTNADVVDDVKIIQQPTKRKSNNHWIQCVAYFLSDLEPLNDISDLTFRCHVH